MTQDGAMNRLSSVLGEDSNQAAEVTQVWADAADASLEVQYSQFPAFDTYLGNHYPKLAQKVEGPKSLSRRSNRKLDGANAEYLDAIHRIAQRNDESHQKWVRRAGDVSLEAAGIALMSGDEEAAEAYLTSPLVPENAVRESDIVGMALLARGDAQAAKRLLLRGEVAPSATHAYNLLDAYLLSGDKDFRTPLLLAARERPLLLARVLAHELDAGSPTDGLYEAAGDNLQARIALAGVTVARRPDSEEAIQAQGYLRRQLERLRPPYKKTIGPADRIGAAIRKDGIFAAFDILDEAMGVAAGDSKVEQSLEYRYWKRDTSSLLGVVGPFLERLPEYSSITSGITGLIGREAAEPYAALKRAEWGDTNASLGMLQDGAPEDGYSAYLRGEKKGQRLLAYRNMLRDLGPDVAMNYLPNLGPESRRAAAFHTLVAVAIRGDQVGPVPELPRLTDTYGSLSQLYTKAEEIVTDQNQGGVNNTAAELAGAEVFVGLIQNGVVDKAGLQEALARIRSINNPAEEKRLLNQLIQANALPQ